MAPKVVGFDQKVVMVVTCNNCSAIVEYVEKDVDDKALRFVGDVDTVYYVVCPNCSEHINNVKRFV